MHVPVLLHEVTTLLDPRPGDLLVDGTLGLGGHARGLLPALSPGGTLLGLDLDPTRLEDVEQGLVAEVASRHLDVTVRTRHESYDALPSVLADIGRKADGLLLDLGFATDQLAPERGFSFAHAGPLQMTYDPGAKSLLRVIAETSEADLGRAIRDWGDERFWRRIARSISIRAKAGELRSTTDLRDAIVTAMPRVPGHGKAHPATRTFQALRILANREIEHLDALLAALPDVMAPGGRVAIISFHSLEDNRVARAFREMQKGGLGRATPKPVTASLAEVVENLSSRSAKLRGFRFDT